jgi:MFS family permease
LTSFCHDEIWFFLSKIYSLRRLHAGNLTVFTVGPNQYQQCICLRHEGGSESYRERTKLASENSTQSNGHLLMPGQCSFQTWFNVAYCLMLIPSQIILTYVRPSFWLSGLEICWGIITGLIATTTNAKQVYVLRAFLGLCESSAWPGMMTLLSTH